MRLTSLMAATGLLFATTLPAGAVQVAECNDWTANVQQIAEPWEKNTRVFGNGTIRIALLDTGGEPVCCSMHLLVMAPTPMNDPGDGGRMCALIRDTKDLGFESIDFPRITARYDAGRGTLLTIPVTYYVDGLTHRRGMARVRINSATAKISAE